MNTEKKEYPLISFPLLYLGLLLLANPALSILDLLPNSVGAVLVILSLRRIPPAFLYFREVRDTMLRICWLSLSKIIAGYFSITVIGVNAAERGILAVFGLCYFILELLFVFPAFRNFFRAMGYLDERYGVSASGGIKTEKGFQSVDSLLVLTYVFFVVRGLASFLPECLFLYSYDFVTGEGTFAFMVERLYVPLVIVCQVIGYVFMAVWFAFMYKYLSGVRRDPDLDRVLREEDGKITDIARSNAYSGRLFSFAFMFLAVAVGLNIDLVFDNINVLPDFVSAFLFGLFFLCLVRFIGKKLPKIGITASALYFASALAAYIVETRFSTRYGVEALLRSPDAYRLYTALRILSVVNTVFAISVFVLLGLSLYRLVSLRLTSDGDPMSYAARRTEEQRKYFRNRSLIFTVIGVLDAVLTAIHVFLRGYTVRLPASEEHLGTSTVVLEQFGWFWIITVVSSIIFLVYTIYLSTQIEIEWKEAFEE